MEEELGVMTAESRETVDALGLLGNTQWFGATATARPFPSGTLLVWSPPNSKLCESQREGLSQPKGLAQRKGLALRRVTGTSSQSFLV